MAFKGTAGVSASGASMSKYDVEVEARLSKLEAAVEALQGHSHGGSTTATGDDHDRIEKLVKVIKAELDVDVDV